MELGSFVRLHCLSCCIISWPKSD